MEIPKRLEDGTMELNDRYQEILKLDKMLDAMEIPHETIRRYDGWQVIYPNDKDRVADVIECFGSYGHEEDLLEIMGLLTEEEGRVLGYLTAIEVCERMAKHYYGM